VFKEEGGSTLSSSNDTSLLVLLRLRSFFFFFWFRSSEIFVLLIFLGIWSFGSPNHSRAMEFYIFFFPCFLISSGRKVNTKRLVGKRHLHAFMSLAKVWLSFLLLHLLLRPYQCFFAGSYKTST